MKRLSSRHIPSLWVIDQALDTPQRLVSGLTDLRNVQHFVDKFRLELDVSDKTAVAIVVMFDETATNLVKCSIESITEVGDEIIPEESVEESAGLSTVDTRADVQTPRLKRLARHPSVSTPSKPTEDEKNKRVDLEDSDAEMSCPSSDAQEDANGICPSEKRKKKRLVHNTY
ncbi:hypothetical protein Tco_1132356 [Tanacetum coccineum]|uniref:Uncharacterized protein n=1 Tax=Tanacetum coccineum TaxID=301880 RepID=A0ABQ5JBN4_9ASTR